MNNYYIEVGLRNSNILDGKVSSFDVATSDGDLYLNYVYANDGLKRVQIYAKGSWDSFSAVECA